MEKGIYEQLCEPFPIDVVELKPGATTKDKTKALALAYIDKRMYDARLDAVVGPENWSDRYEVWEADKVFCYLTVNGVTKSDVGECADQNDKNAGTIAVAQAFKRACSRFGLGRYLYSLSGEWLDYDDQKKRFSGNVQGAVRAMYAKAGLLEERSDVVATRTLVDPPAGVTRTGNNSYNPPSETADRAVTNGYQSGAYAPDSMARSMADLVTPKQLGLIRASAREMGLDPDAECVSVMHCKTEELSKRGASSFIDHLRSASRPARATA